MPNSSSDTHRDGEGEKGVVFASLLTFLCPEDADEAARRYLCLHQKLAGYFRLRGMLDPVNDADDALDRAAKNILKGVPIPDIERFCIGIARNIVLERLRQKKREESAFLQFLNHSQDNSTEAMVDRITKLLKPCFEQLDAEDRDLLTSYCRVPAGVDRAEHRRRLAERLQSTIAALRIRVTRLRRGLGNCVKALSKKL